MSQSVKDLPDPLGDRPVTTPAASADDMIAQLADEAIDQLIADADRDAPSAPPAPAPSDPPVFETAVPPPAGDALADVLGRAVAHSAEPVPPESQPIVPAPVETLPPVDTAAPVAAETPPPPESRAEMRALLGEAARNTPDPAGSPLLRPLVWLNAPFAGVPDAVRNVLGQVAIITLLNALAVLLYVLFFRG